MKISADAENWRTQLENFMLDETFSNYFNTIAKEITELIEA